MADYYVITGTLTPDATGDYFEVGIYNNKPYYVRNDGLFGIGYIGGDTWFIGPPPFFHEGLGWVGHHAEIADTYEPVFGSAGVATVAEGLALHQIWFNDWSF